MNTQHPILGLDLGKQSFVAAWPPETDTPPKRWPTLEIHYKNPNWWTDFLSIVAPNAIICAEPTGAHLLQPIVTILNRYTPTARVYQVQGRTTAAYRESFVSASKTDRFDAIALALIARDISVHNTPHRVFAYDPALESAVQRLRMIVNTHQRTTKEITRAKNRLNVFAFSLWPELAGSSTWLRCVHNGHVTPRQIRDAATQQPPSPPFDKPHTRRYAVALANRLPDIDADPDTVAAILSIEPELDRLETEQAAFESRIAHLIQRPPFEIATRRMLTKPGASIVAIAALHVATHGRILEMTKDEFVAAVAIAPRTNKSGLIDKTRANRKGYRPARTALHLWTLFLLSPTAGNDSVQQYYNARKSANTPHPLTAAKTKLARELWGRAHDARLDPPTMPAEEQ